MGGKPQKPKIQAYVDQQWFDEFEVYRSSHKLNQSKGLETILALFFSKQGESPLLETVNQDEVLRAELSEFKHEVEKRLLAIEKRLKIKLANESVAISIEATTALQEIKESAANLSVESVIDLNESEIESAAVEEAIALNTLEDIPETAIPSSELVEVVNEVSVTVDTGSSVKRDKMKVREVV